MTNSHDRAREMFSDPPAEIREQDSHAAHLKYVDECLTLLRNKDYTGLPPWCFDTAGDVWPGLVEREIAELEKEKAYLEAEIAAGRPHPVDSHLHRQDSEGM